MERFVSAIVRRPRLVVIAVFVVTAALATQLGHLHFEIRRRANVPDGHPYVQVQNRIADLFGGEAIVIIGVVASEGDVFAPTVPAAVKRVTDGLRATPGLIETSLLSLAAARSRRRNRSRRRDRRAPAHGGGADHRR